ncbi:MAG: arginine--tRNA ligase [Thaumarchaeota archaeon]|nr:arginine--tRNA ligase [Nitrososphaerota archaeon]
MTLRLLLDEIRSNIGQICIRLGYPTVQFEVAEAAKSDFGDISCNVAFLLAKPLGKRPYDIAKEISSQYEKNLGRFVKKVTPHQSGYINFIANYSALNNSTIKSSVREDYGSINIGNKTRIVVEHTSVNPNKALHVGHVRNIIIGDTISRILKKANYDVRILNYVDDSGLQVADIVVGFKYGGFAEEPPKDQKFDHYCGDIVYVKTTEMYETDKKLEEFRTTVLKEIEEGKSEIAKFANNITRRVLAEQLKTCWRLGSTYDCLNFESQIVRSNLWKIVFEKMKEMEIIQLEKEGKNTGCWVIRSETDEEDKVLVRSSGLATYIAKDIPYAAWKLGLLGDPFYYVKYGEQPGGKILWETILERNSNAKIDFSGERVITVIDSRQSRLQKIITRLMSSFKSQEGAYVHLGYEAVTLSAETASMLNVETGGKQIQMSGRKGIYVNADYVLDILGVKTYEEAKKRNPELDEIRLVNIAEAVAVGALRYAMVKQDLDKIITFDMAESLSLEGDTGPYIQYSYARAVRILEKAGVKPQFDTPFDNLNTEYEINLIKAMSKFDIRIEEAAKNLSPKVMARYCYELAVAFNAFYEHVKVLTAESKSLVNERLCLVHCFKETLAKALDVIGVSSPDRM